MNQTTPEPGFVGQPATSNAAPSGASSLPVSIFRGFARGASLVYRAAKHIDAAMGRALEAQNLRTEGRSQGLSLIGSGAILICSFAPVVNVPVIGAVTYFSANNEFARVAGVLLVIIGIASLSLALLERYLWLYPIGLCALSIAIGTLVSYKWYLAQIASTQSSGLFDYFTQSASKGLTGRSSLSFGFPLLIYGAVLVIIAALMRPRAARAVSPELQPD
jgi:hypothetical protein